MNIPKRVVSIPGVEKIMVSIGEIVLSPQDNRVLTWKIIEAKKKLRFLYPLSESSLVFDLGGYKGDFAGEIFSRYKCEVFIFEPVRKFAQEIKKRFRGDKKIKIFEFGLGDRVKIIQLNLNGDATSEFKSGGKPTKAKLLNIKNFMSNYHVNQVDLIKINIEGGEYDLMEYLIKSGLIRRFKNIQIQFHPFIENAEIRMRRIQHELYKTHKLTYSTKFVWENWERK